MEPWSEHKAGVGVGGAGRPLALASATRNPDPPCSCVRHFWLYFGGHGIGFGIIVFLPHGSRNHRVMVPSEGHV